MLRRVKKTNTLFSPCLFNEHAEVFCRRYIWGQLWGGQAIQLSSSSFSLWSWRVGATLENMPAISNRSSTRRSWERLATSRSPPGTSIHFFGEFLSIIYREIQNSLVIRGYQIPPGTLVIRNQVTWNQMHTPSPAEFVPERYMRGSNHLSWFETVPWQKTVHGFAADQYVEGVQVWIWQPPWRIYLRYSDLFMHI